MTGFDDEPQSALLDERPARPHPVIAWVVIVIVVAVVAGFQNYRRLHPEAAEGEPPDVGSIEARLIVGMSEWVGGNRQELLKNLDMLDKGTLRQRLRYVVMTGELVGPKEATQRLILLETEVGGAAPEDRRLAQLLRRLYANYADKKFTDVLNEEDAAFLKEKLGWFGELALGPPQGDPAARDEAMEPARRLAMVLMGATVGGCGLGLLGVVLLIVVLVTAFRYGARRGFEVGTGRGGFYAETFAVWLVLFVLFQLLGALLGRGLLAGQSELFPGALAMLLSLIALAWPVLRGVPWAMVKQDIGWTAGKGFLVEFFSGLLCYVTCVPLLLLGLLLTFVLMAAARAVGLADIALAANPGGAPIHPVVFLLRKADAWVLFQIFFLASFVAPIVEETFFRGVLYRHLREGTNGAGTGLSFLLSALVVCFLFALVHPQGWLAIPALMSLAFGFTVFREWRGSLLPCMVAHGVSNGLVMLLAVQLLRE
jgi:membrane protease YdiL (CAAX protease family)